MSSDVSFGSAIQQIVLVFEVQLRTRDESFGIANGIMHGLDSSCADAVVAGEEDHPLHRIRVHVQIVSRNDIFGGPRGALCVKKEMEGKW